MDSRKEHAAPEPVYSDFAANPDYAEILLVFADSVPELTARAEHLFRKGEIAALQKFAHQLKGSGGGYGFRTLSEKAARLEEACLDGAEDPITRSLQDLVEHLNRIRC